MKHPNLAIHIAIRHHARIPRLVLDEPTAAMDAEAEAQIFERLASLTEKQSALLISTLALRFCCGLGLW